MSEPEQDPKRTLAAGILAALDAYRDNPKGATAPLGPAAMEGHKLKAQDEAKQHERESK